VKFTERLTVIAANIESVGKSDPLAALIREHEPDVVIVEQAYNARRFLRGIGGYRAMQYRGKEGSGIAVLVKHGIKVQARRPIRMLRYWNGPASKGGRQHRPRVYPALVLAKGRVTFRVLGIHLPTFNNPAAQAESLVAVTRWFNRHPDVPSLAAGDWNRERNQLEDTAAEAGASILSDRTKVDHALVTNCVRASADKLPMPVGPHGWSKYVITATKG
jgi:hypothetical protein